MTEWDKICEKYFLPSEVKAVGDAMQAKIAEYEVGFQLANDRCNELAKQLGETQEKLEFSSQNNEHIMKHYEEVLVNWTVDVQRLEAIRELCTNTLRINRGLPITTLDDDYLVDSDSLAQRILEVSGGVLKEMQEKDSV